MNRATTALIKRSLWTTRWPFAVAAAWFAGAAWFRGITPLSVNCFAILLVWSVLFDTFGFSAEFTLSLPASRRRVLLTQLGVVAVEILALSLGSCLLMSDPALALTCMARGLLVMSVAALLTIALGQRRAVAILLTIVIFGFAPAFWSHRAALAWPGILVCLALAMLFTWNAITTLEGRDF